MASEVNSICGSPCRVQRAIVGLIRQINSASRKHTGPAKSHCNLIDVCWELGMELHLPGRSADQMMLNELMRQQLGGPEIGVFIFIRAPGHSGPDSAGKYRAERLQKDLKRASLEVTSF